MPCKLEKTKGHRRIIYQREQWINYGTFLMKFISIMILIKKEKCFGIEKKGNYSFMLMKNEKWTKN